MSTTQQDAPPDWSITMKVGDMVDIPGGFFGPESVSSDPSVGAIQSISIGTEPSYFLMGESVGVTIVTFTYTDGSVSKMTATVTAA